jgi:hypothetical protein
MKLIKFSFIFSALVGSVFGTTISFNMWFDSGAADYNGVPLDSTYTAYIGTYSGSADQNSTYSDIFADFSVLASGSFSTSTSNEDGYVEIADFNFVDAAFDSQPFYVWFTDGGNQNALITGFGEPIPANGDTINFISYGIDEANIADLTYLVGSHNSAISTTYDGSTVVLNNVPEPSSAFLGMISALGFLRRRR